MTTHLTNPQSASLMPHRSDLTRKVWTLLGHLLAIGRPAPPAVLAARCGRSVMSPELVEFLCSVPGSPMRLTEDRLVTFALKSCYAFARLAAGPRFCFNSTLRHFGSEGIERMIGALISMIDNNSVFRKRKCGDQLGCEFMPAQKRARLIFCNDDGTESEALFLSRRSRSPRIEADSFPVVYRRGVYRKRGEDSLASFSLGAPCKLTTNSETSLLASSDAVLSGHIPKTMSCFKDEKTVAYDPMHHAGLDSIESHIVRTSRMLHMLLIDDQMIGHKACLSLTHFANLLKPFTAMNDTPIDDSYLGTVDCSYADVGFPHKTYYISSPVGGCQPFPSEVQDVQINTDQIVQEGQKSTLPAFFDSSKEPSQMSLTLCKGRKIKLPSEQQAVQKCIPVNKICGRLNEANHTDAHIDQTKKIAEQKIQNKFPNFESFIVEEEEGSGGYGTVYKARRKNDNKIFAIKCPHPKAPRHHVYNELNMVQRFGGENFIIRLEDSFKYGESRCFVLEHVEHDRPEVLKREIDVSQLRWYAYCMFEALANLHKHGIVHRDIKPGNFLFSREVNIGYLIYFNLAKDLHKKNRPLKRSKMDSGATAARTPLLTTTHPPTKSRKFVNTKNEDSVHRAIERTNMVDSKNLKASAGRTKPSTSLCKGKQSMNKSHVPLDSSGVTSSKDMTNPRTRPVDRMMQPMPYKGRKEVLSLAHEALQSQKYKRMRVSVSKSRRTPPQTIDRKLVYLSPMPLQSSGVAVVGAGLLSHNGDVKKQTECPCPGTKGFRAPEVLFRSAHQGPKIDVWSAGVTMLYLMIGKSPFYGDPNENIINIANLRGSEELWEVAKLHNKESAFPAELFDVKFLPSMKLKKWCQLHSKRPSFNNQVPDALYDFLDKCLTVNPRLRISAEEALQHEFLTPCHDILKQQTTPSPPTI